MKMNFDLYQTEMAKLIARRANGLGMTRASMYVMMDIEACHCNGCPLDLDGLATAKTSDFVHDLTGITANLNRKTGKLENCFVPRYAKPTPNGHPRRAGA